MIRKHNHVIHNPVGLCISDAWSGLRPDTLKSEAKEMAQTITISISAIAKRIDATPQAVKRHLDKLGIKPIGFADIQKKRPLYSGDIIRKMKGCKRRKKPVSKSVIKSVRLSNDQWAAMQEYINKTGFTFTEIIQNGITKAKKLETKIVHVQAADPALIRQLAYIGNNLNQLARSVNSANRKGQIPAGLPTAIFASLCDIEEQLEGLIT